MSMELIITFAAILVSWFVFTGLVRVLKVAVGTAIKVTLIVFLVQILFGIGPEILIKRVMELGEQVFSTLK